MTESSSLILLRSLQTRIKTLDKIIKEKEKKIDDLSSQLQEMKAKLSSAHQQVNDMETALKDAMLEIASISVPEELTEIKEPAKRKPRTST